MYRAIIIALFILTGSEATSQLRTNLSLSNKWLDNIEHKSKNARDKIDRYQKAYKKDSIKQAKQTWKENKDNWRLYKKQNKDSLSDLNRWTLARLMKYQIIVDSTFNPYPQPRQTKYDSLGYPIPLDSIDSIAQMFSQYHYYADAQQMYKQYAIYDSAYLDELKVMGLDSSTMVHRMEMKQRLHDYIPLPMAQKTDTDVAQGFQTSALDMQGNLPKVDYSGVTDLLGNLDPGEMLKGQSQLEAEKKVFSELPNLDKKEEGVERESMKGTPFIKRIFLNGFLNLSVFDPPVMDVDLQIGYNITKKLSAGGGIFFRENFKDRPTLTTGDSHGYTGFANYDFLKGFFLYAEYRASISKSIFKKESPTTNPFQSSTNEEKDSKPIWEHAPMAGIGRGIKISNSIIITMTVLYDFNWRNNALYSRPFVFRLGYQINW